MRIRVSIGKAKAPFLRTPTDPGFSKRHYCHPYRNYLCDGLNAAQATEAPDKGVRRPNRPAAAGSPKMILGVGAMGGGFALMAGRHGEILPLPVSALAGSFFKDYFVPGAILFVTLGLGSLAAAAVTWRRRPAGPILAFAVGGSLLIWLFAEIAIVGYSNHPPLQALYLALEVVIILVAIAWIRQTRSLASSLKKT